MLRSLAVQALLFAIARGIAAAPDGGTPSVVASCADRSVIFATRPEQVRCEGAIVLPSGLIPRVGSLDDRNVAVAAQVERWRESDLDFLIAHAPRRAPYRTHPTRVSLDPGEHADLERIVALGRARAAATLENERLEGSPIRMRLAHSRAFDTQLRRNFAGRGISLDGPVLVFTLEPGSAPRAPMPSFGQGGVTFRPDSGDARQLGWIVAGGATTPHAKSRLGYVVLPAGFDVERPLAVFWGDAVTATRPWRSR